MRRASFILGALAVVGSANAVVVNYTNAVDWQTAVDTYSSISFTSFGAGTALTNQYAGVGVLFDGNTTITAQAPPIFVDGKGIDVNNGSSGAINITFTHDMTAFATDFPGAAHYDLFEGNTLVGSSDNYGGSGTGFFGGVVSSVAFNKVAVTDWFDNVVFVDNIHYSNAVVPEPASMIALGVGLVAVIRRRRRSK